MFKVIKKNWINIYNKDFRINGTRGKFTNVRIILLSRLDDKAIASKQVV